KETMSREYPGYFTFLSALVTNSGVMIQSTKASRRDGLTQGVWFVSYQPKIEHRLAIASSFHRIGL
ncbi:MAG: hypothetical protein ACXWDN_02790, partial [Limisphaerales bacterium]